MLISNLAGITEHKIMNENQGLIHDEGKTKTLESIEKLVFENTHNAIKAILKVAPLAGGTALHQVSKIDEG